MIKEKIEEKIQRTDRKLLELALQTERLNNEHQALLEKLLLTPEELKDFAENPQNFSPILWEQLQEEKKKINDRLNLELNNVNDANKTKEVISERGKVQQHWLFVR